MLSIVVKEFDEEKKAVNEQSQKAKTSQGNDDAPDDTLNDMDMDDESDNDNDNYDNVMIMIMIMIIIMIYYLIS